MSEQHYDRETHDLFTDSPADRFMAFHRANPHVYKTLVIKARQWRRRHPNRTVGIRMLWEAMRWGLLMQTDAEDYKLNDHYTSFYARMILDCEPDLKGFFNIRGRA